MKNITPFQIVFIVWAGINVLVVAFCILKYFLFPNKENDDDM